MKVGISYCKLVYVINLQHIYADNIKCKLFVCID